MGLIILQKCRVLCTLIVLSLVSSSFQVSIDKVSNAAEVEVPVRSEELQDPTEIPPTQLPPKGVWVPDLVNEIWQELGFPIIPEGDSPSSGESTTYQPADPEFIENVINELNLTLVENRVAGGRARCQCGRPVKRIVDGVQAKINDIPWTVALLRKSSLGSIFGGGARPFCGGTLINDRYVLTASHCVDGQTERTIQVLVNEEDFLLSTETAGGTRTFGVSKIIMHPGYSRRTVDNDIALIKLDTPVPISVSGDAFQVVPACLPANNDNDFSGLEGTVAGWGTTSENGRTSSSLLKVAVPIISNAVCNSKEARYPGKITDSMMCAGFLDKGGKDACQGDSGGPMIIDNGTRKTLVGVVSWGYGCAQKRAPGVYTRVARFPDWILANSKDAEWCTD